MTWAQSSDWHQVMMASYAKGTIWPWHITLDSQRGLFFLDWEQAHGEQEKNVQWMKWQIEPVDFYWCWHSMIPESGIIVCLRYLSTGHCHSQPFCSSHMFMKGTSLICHAFERQSLKYFHLFLNMLFTCTLYYDTGPSCLIRTVCKYRKCLEPV